MANQKLSYNGVVAEVITLANLANNSSREGTLVVNTANLFIDYILSGKLTTGATAGTGDSYLWLSSSDATNISYPAVGTDNNITIPLAQMAGFQSLVPGQLIPGTELIFIARVAMTGVPATTAVPFANISLAQIFGGQIPPQFAVGVTNMSGVAFGATGGNYVVNTNGVFYTII